MNQPRPRHRRPNSTRISIGIILLVIGVSCFGLPDAIHAMTVGVKRTMTVRVSLFTGPIIARAFLFNVPFRHQQHALSCEVASLRTALAGIGIAVSEWDLWLQLPKDQTQKHVVAHQTVWGDPNQGFVGNVNGRMPKTGYGVFADPIMDVAQLYANPTRIRVDDGHAIDAALAARHPVIVWTVIGPLPPTSYHWTLPNGTRMDAPAYEHTVVVVGYRGTADQMEGVYVVDPLTALRYESWDEFQARTAPFGHVGVEIGKKK